MNVEDISHFNSRPLYATKWGSYLLDANCITPNLHQRLSRQQHTVCVCSDMEMKLFGIHVWSVSNWLRCYIMFRFQVCNEENAIRNGSQNWMMIHRDARRWMSAMSIWAWFIILVKFMVSCGLGRILAFAYEWLGRCCTYCLSCAVQHKCARCVLSMEFIQRAQKNQIIKKKLCWILFGFAPFHAICTSNGAVRGTQWARKQRQSEKILIIGLTRCTRTLT